jgi:actin-related protein 6
VDSGYSFTHITPFYKGNIILDGIRRLVTNFKTLHHKTEKHYQYFFFLRINIGGKHLTNYLKEVISYRQLMVMDETYVINQLKEELCFVSADFYNDVKIAK